jgi:hypothetical protein
MIYAAFPDVNPQALQNILLSFGHPLPLVHNSEGVGQIGNGYESRKKSRVQIELPTFYRLIITKE